jgi:hypothetical protein
MGKGWIRGQAPETKQPRDHAPLGLAGITERRCRPLPSRIAAASGLSMEVYETLSSVLDKGFPPYMLSGRKEVPHGPRTT